MPERPIGIFDSGVGGLSVLQEIRKELPHESVIYVADSGNCPYGSKSEEDTLHLSRKHIEFLLDRGCKLIVIACNTVTAVAIERFRADYDVPFVGMEPALKPAALLTRSKKVGILATENTINGKLFQQTFDKYANGIEVFVQPGHGLVELVEEGDHESERARELLKQYVLPMMKKGADTLVLGCTHYPFLKKMIHCVTQNRITVLDPAGAVAAQTRRVLAASGLVLENNKHPGFHFFTTGRETITRQFVSRTMDRPYLLEQIEV